MESSGDFSFANDLQGELCRRTHRNLRNGSSPQDLLGCGDAVEVVHLNALYVNRIGKEGKVPE